MSQFQENLRTDKRTEGHTLLDLSAHTVPVVQQHRP